MNMHGPSFFSFHFLSFSISFPKLTIFTNFRLYMACKMWKITALTWEISSWRLVEKFHISAFPMYYSLNKRIGEHEITKVKKIYLLWIDKIGHKNKHKKIWMKWNDTKWTIWYFQQCACVKAIYFAPVVTITYHMKNNKVPTTGLRLGCPCWARAQLLKMLYISTHLNVPHGEIMQKTALYIEKLVLSISRTEWMNGICLIWSRGRLISPSLPVGDYRYLNLSSQKRPTGRNLGGNRLVRRSGATSRGTVVLVFCLRMRRVPLTLSIFVGMKWIA